MTSATTIWLTITIIALVAEGCTAGLTTIWFAIGGAVSFILALFNVNTYVQIAAFFIVSVLLLILTRPLVAKTLVKKTEKTNADSIIGKKAIVIEDINELKATGQIKVSGSVWSAKAEEIIQKDETVIIEAIKGVHAIVKKEEN